MSEPTRRHLDGTPCINPDCHRDHHAPRHRAEPDPIVAETRFHFAPDSFVYVGTHRDRPQVTR